jgi:hypothetical protein
MFQPLSESFGLLTGLPELSSTQTADEVPVSGRKVRKGRDKVNKVKEVLRLVENEKIKNMKVRIEPAE